MRWRLLLEEYGPEIVYIKGMHNTVADAISRLDQTPPGTEKNLFAHWQTREDLHFWFIFMAKILSSSYTDVVDATPMQYIFAQDLLPEEEITPPTVAQVAQAQHADPTLRTLFREPE